MTPPFLSSSTKSIQVGSHFHPHAAGLVVSSSPPAEALDEDFCPFGFFIQDPVLAEGKRLPLPGLADSKYASFLIAQNTR